MKPEEQDSIIENKTADTVVRFPRDGADSYSGISTEQDRLFNALGFLFPQNKILTSGLPVPFEVEQGAQIAQIACVKRSEDVADVFVLIRTADDTAETGFRERVLPMNGFRPAAAHGYIQRFVMQEAPLAIPQGCTTADDRLAALELRGILLANLH